MRHINDTNRPGLGRATLPLAPLLTALLAGCPSFQLTQVEIAPGSIDGQRFTLNATVSVTEEDPPVDDDGNLGGGRGVLGVWLPPDWTVTHPSTNPEY